MASERFSSRLAQRKTVLDNASRMRRLNKFLDLMESDNYHNDPNPNLTTINEPVDSSSFVKEKNGKDAVPSKSIKQKKGSAAYYKEKYGRSFSQLVANDQIDAEKDNRPSYMDAAVDDSKFPRRHFCAVCGFEGSYECVPCGARFCSVKCKNVHVETRCVHWSGGR